MEKFYIANFTTMYDGREFSEKVLVASNNVAEPTTESLIEEIPMFYVDQGRVSCFEDEFELEETTRKHYTDNMGTALYFSNVQKIPSEDGLILKDYLPSIVL